MHPPNVVTLSLANAELGSSESTSPLASAPSSPRGSPDARASSIISTPTRAASQQQQQQKQLDEDLVPDDEEILYSPAQQQYPQQYQQHQQPPFVATGNVNMSFQDDEEQDEASHLHDQQGLHGRKDHFFPVSNSSLLVIRNEMDDDFDDHDDGRETPFDEATGPDHHFTIRKDWMSSSSSADPSLDGHESERIQSIIHNIHDAENGHHNEKQATTTTSLADDEDSQPPSLAPLDRMDPVPVPPPASTRTMQDMDSSASHLCLLSTPTPVSTMRNLYEPAQDPEEEMNEPITQTALNSTMIMTTPDHPLKSPPILVKTTNLVPVWDLPINGQQESAVLRSKSEASESASSSSSSLFTPPVPPPPPGEESTRDDEPHLTDERRLTKLPTLRESMMSGGVPMINDSAPVSRAVDDPMSTKLEGDDDEGEGDDDDDDVVNAMGMVSQRHNPIPRGGPSLAKPAALRSTSAPVHALYATDPTRTNPSPFSFHDDGQRGEGTIPEPSYMIREKSPLSLLEERPERVLRSVSDIPKSSSMSDWKKYLVDDSPQVKGIADISQWLDKDDTKQFEPRRKTSFREMTPKQDFKLSEKSAAWLQEEFKRRSTIKKEINAAILARSDLRKEDHEIHNEGSFRMEDAMALQASFSTSASEVGGEDAFAMALSKALKALPQSSISAATAAELSQRSEDDEVAALTAFRSSQQPIESSLQTIPSDEEGVTRPRRLMYGTSIPRSSSEPVVFSGESHDETIDFREDMMQFSTETRRMLHQSHMFSRKSGDPDLRFNWLNASNSNRNFESPMEVPGVLNGTLHRPTISAMTDASDSSPYDDLVTPPLVESLDSYLGIAKGDITLSLLNEDHSISARSTWANRVRVAIWRTRRMRRGRAGGTSVLQEHRQSNPSSRGRSSHHVDTDTARVAGGVRSVEASEQSALDHLMNDRIDEALECFEEIIFAYYNYFERSLKAREANPGGSHPTTDFRPYIGAALHNLGVLNLLKGEYSQALSYFGRAVENRKGCLGESHNDHVVSQGPCEPGCAFSKISSLTSASSNLCR